MNRTVCEVNGTLFEAEIMQRLQVDYPECEIVPDVEVYSHYLKDNTQIDMLVVTPKGLFAIEAKGWKYSITGGYNDKHWRGVARTMNNMVVFNPIDQNKIHIRALLLKLFKMGITPPKVHNIVCVPDGTRIDTTCEEVCNLSALVGLMKVMERREPCQVNVQLMTRLLIQVKG